MTPAPLTPAELTALSAAAESVLHDSAYAGMTHTMADYVLQAIDALAVEQAKSARLRAALEAKEWTYWEGLGECIWCEWYEGDGHAPDCIRQAALR